jgi:hypothetical protein
MFTAAALFLALCLEIPGNLGTEITSGVMLVAG